MHHHRLIELRGKISLIRRAQVSTPLEFLFKRALGMTFLQISYRLVVTDPRKRGFNLFQL